MNDSNANRAGFTLIEVIIVVAILAILAALVVPNLLQAQTRSKVSRAKADLATLRTGLEAYAVDHGTYPLNRGGLGFSGALIRLTKPTRYLEVLPKDPFAQDAGYFYTAVGRIREAEASDIGEFLAASIGPDGDLDSALATTTHYDPTNGTISDGDIVVTHAGGMK